MERSEVGAKIRAARRQRRYTLRDVEEYTGIHYSTVSRIERGYYQITTDTLFLMADMFGVAATRFIRR